MALVHNIIIRGLNSIWTNAPLVCSTNPEGKTDSESTAASSLKSCPDIANLMGYAQMLLIMIHQHHHGEETVIFPLLQEKVDMGINVDQHESFQTPMKAMEQYIGDVKEGREIYDWKMMRRVTEEFAEPLIEHLREEIITLSPENLSVFSSDELAAINLAFGKYLKSQGGFFTFLPMGLSAHNRLDSPNWPPLPKPIQWFAMNIGWWYNRSYWKFSPYTRTGEPQTYMPITRA